MGGFVETSAGDIRGGGCAEVDSLAEDVPTPKREGVVSGYWYGRGSV